MKEIRNDKPVSIRRATIREEKGNLMCGFRTQADEVPHRIGIFAVSGRVSLLSVDKGWKENGVTNEKNWSIVPDKVPISLLRVKLHCKSSWITGGISATTFSTNLCLKHRAE